jgi:cysteine-rich repeat protein
LCTNGFFWLASSNQCVSIDLILCGDGTWIEQYESCDDGNSVNGDGCNLICQVEPDYECRPQDKLPTGESLCVFTKQISIVFDRL